MASADPLEDFEDEAEESAETLPKHGFQGDRGPPETNEELVPAGLTIAISREAGSRGSSIAKSAAKKLDWESYDQGLLEYIAQQPALREPLGENLPAASKRWAEERLQALLREQNLSKHPAVVGLARTVLGLGARGEVVLIGRGAGYILPSASTLHVRIVAPVADRVAYMSQWLRLTREAATEQVRARDARRAEFLDTHFHRRPSDIYAFDLVLNSSLLGEELCASLIVQAARGKEAVRLRGLA
jgi:cytidylate kinase